LKLCGFGKAIHFMLLFRLKKEKNSIIYKISLQTINCILEKHSI